MKNNAHREPIAPLGPRHAAIWTRPWTARVYMRPAPGTGVIYEFACHEGNYAIEHTLRGARMQELEASR